LVRRVDPGDGMDDVEKRKFLTLPDSNCDLSIIQPVANYIKVSFTFLNTSIT
jgi:hypothetical protein